MSTAAFRLVLLLAGVAVAGLGGCRAADRVDARSVSSAPAGQAYNKPGFVTFVGKSNKLWVFRADSSAAEAYATEGPPPRSVVRVGVGPHGLDVAAPDRETLAGYLAE